MLEGIMWISGVVIAAGYCYTKFSSYPFKWAVRRSRHTHSNPLVYSRPVTYLGTPGVSSFEYPSSTYITARLPHAYLRDYRI